VQPDLSTPDVPKTIAWCEDSLCVGFKRDYFLIKVILALYYVFAFVWCMAVSLFTWRAVDRLTTFLAGNLAKVREREMTQSGNLCSQGNSIVADQ